MLSYNSDLVLAIIATALYSFTAVGFWLAVVLKKTEVVPKVLLLALFGLGVNLISVGYRWYVTGHAPGNLYELNNVGALLAVLVYFVLQWKCVNLRMLGLIVFPAVALLLGWSLTLPNGFEQLKPEYQSIWLILHIFAAFTASAFYLLSFSSSCVYLVRRYLLTNAKWMLPFGNLLEEGNVRLVSAGFVFHAAMLASGAIWAQQAWGSYWSWDPVETWSLISWLFYGIILHSYFSLSWRGVRMQLMTVVGFTTIVFSYWYIPHLPLTNF